MRIAFLEDDPAQAEMIKGWLSSATHACEHFPEARRFLTMNRRESYDLVILDWELPESSGLEVLSWIRDHEDWHIPVLFVTHRDSERDIVQALSAGADDYMTKPVSREVMLARIKALSRRYERAGGSKDLLEVGGFRIDRDRNTITRHGEAVELTEKEYQLALMLFTNVGRLLSRDHMLSTVWGVGPGLATRTVDTHISRLRRKLALLPEHGWRLKSVYQHGYRLEQVTLPQNI